MTFDFVGHIIQSVLPVSFIWHMALYHFLLFTCKIQIQNKVYSTREVVPPILQHILFCLYLLPSSHGPAGSGTETALREQPGYAEEAGCQAHPEARAHLPETTSGCLEVGHQLILPHFKLLLNHHFILAITHEPPLSLQSFILLTLPFPSLSWMFFRYQRGSRSLAANLSMSQSSAGAAVVAAEVQAEEQEEYDIPEEVETVIGELQPSLTFI